MLMTSNQGWVRRPLGTSRLLAAALVGICVLSGGSTIHAATIQLDVSLAQGTSILSSGGTAVSGGTAYVGSFFNGSSAMSKSSVAALWNNTRTGFNDLWSKFVSVASGAVTSGGFSISTAAEVNSVAGKSMVGKNVYVLVVDNAASPNGFLLLAADGSGSVTFADPLDTFGDNFTSLEVSGEASTIVIPDVGAVDIPVSTTVVGTAGSYNTSTDRWTMASIPAGTSLVLNGANNVTHYWGSTYTDAGVTPSSGVTTTIRNATNGVVADFATMAAALGTYTISYTAGSSTVTRTVNVKLQNPNADADNDGLTNLMEYLVGGSLTTDDSSKRPAVALSGSELILTFTARTDIGLSTQVALGFVTSTSLGVAFAPETLTKKAGVSQSGVPAGYEKQQWSFSTTAPTKFARIKVTVPTSLSEGT